MIRSTCSTLLVTQSYHIAMQVQHLGNNTIRAWCIPTFISKILNMTKQILFLHLRVQFLYLSLLYRNSMVPGLTINSYTNFKKKPVLSWAVLATTRCSWRGFLKVGISIALMSRTGKRKTQLRFCKQGLSQNFNRKYLRQTL